MRIRLECDLAYRPARSVLAFFLLLSLAACPKSDPMDEPDGGTTGGGTGGGVGGGVGGGAGGGDGGDGGTSLLPVGSRCTADEQCAGPGTPRCIIEELAPLAELVDSPNQSASDLAAQTVIPFPGNYCSNVVPCMSDEECGFGGKCFLPLVDVPESNFNSLVNALEMSEEERALVRGFRTYGVCLKPCEDASDCPRAGYHCAVPLGQFVSILAPLGARLETYCVGDPEALASCDVCDENATCDDGTSPVVCTCNEGYMGDGYVCEPISCTPPCGENASCVSDGEGGSVCECDEGYAGDGFTCTSSTCDPACGDNAFCAPSHECQCEDGYEGDPVAGCTNVDDCADEPCQNGGTCTDGIGGYTCECALGFTGDDCETNIDDCDPNPCEHGGECTDGVDEFTCECAPGWEGPTCETNIDDCSPNPCKNGGTCTDGVDGYTCRCEDGWSGPTCETPVSGCADDPCMNGGTCTDTGPATYECDCPTGWTGKNCESDVDDCDPNPCQNGGTCTDTGTNRYECDCPAGYEGASCETNIDDCSPNPCQNGGSCTDGVDEYTCSCAPGWTGPTCATPNTCTLVYDFETPTSVNPSSDTNQPVFYVSGTSQRRNVGPGQVVLRVPADGTTPISGTAELLNYWMKQFFESAAFGTNVMSETYVCQSSTDFNTAPPDFDESATPPPPTDEVTTCLPMSNTTAVATGTIAVSGGSATVTFTCNDSDYSDAAEYTPAEARSTDPGCLTHYLSYGRVRCTSGLCGVFGAPPSSWTEKTAKWSQVLLPITLGSNFTTITMGNPNGTNTSSYAIVPNDDAGWTGISWRGTLNAELSTCFD